MTITDQDLSLLSCDELQRRIHEVTRNIAPGEALSETKERIVAAYRRELANRASSGVSVDVDQDDQAHLHIRV